MEISIRKGKREDLQQIHQLVVELAVYENEPDAVTATLADYQEAFDDNIFQTLVAVHDNTIIGLMLYYPSYSTWKGRMIHLEDFIITETYRRKGIGQLLFDEFLKVAAKEKAILTRWQVLNWNEPAIKFYEKIGATIEQEWDNCKIYL